MAPEWRQAGRRAALPQKLLQLQMTGRLQAAPFTTVPSSGLTAIEDVLDEAGDLKSVVLLGFTRDGWHLVSYTTQPVSAADGQEGYCLQLWAFRPGVRCRRLWSVPLFRTQQYLDCLADEDSFLAADDMLLTVAESADCSLLVVHGRSADPADTCSRERQLTNYITILPGPLHSGAAQLQVVHASYCTSYPHPPFNPYHSLLPLPLPLMQAAPAVPGDSGGSSSSSSGRLAIALYTGGSLWFLHAHVSRLPAVQLRQHRQSGSSSSSSGGEDEEGASAASSFTLPHGVAPAGAGAVEGQQQPQQPPALAGQQASVEPLAASWGSSGQQGERSRGSLPSHWQQQQQQHQQQRQSSWRQQEVQQQQPGQQPEQLPGQPDVASGSGAMECELELRSQVLSCAHAAPASTLQQHQQLQQQQPVSSWGPKGQARVACAAARQHLDLEHCIFAALLQQGLPPASLLDYAAAPVLSCCWQEQEGVLLLAVLRLSRQPTEGRLGCQTAQHSNLQPPPLSSQQQQAPVQHAQQPGGGGGTRSACVLLHAAADSGEAQVVEWMQPPYPWSDDLSAYLVQQTAAAGLAFDKAPAYFAEFLRGTYSTPPPRHRLPLVLTNRSVLGTGASLQHIAHPFIPQAILGYTGSR